MDYLKREIPLCEVCQKPANQTCGGCKLVYYCSKGHQKLGWREGHKLKCCAFKVQYSDTLGRHMVATRDIQQGEMILKEKPAVIGPKIASTARCLNCNIKLQPMKMSDNTWDFYKCTSCRWPMCGQKCEKSDIHKPECELMTKRKYQSNITYVQADKQEAAYCVITPLRVLLLKESNPLQFENIVNLESHLEDRINTPLYVVLKANLVTFVTQVLGLQFDEETILKVASVLDTNAFEVKSPDGLRKFRAIYVTAAMMNHSCKPNTRHIYVGEDFNMAVLATVPIAKGDLITATYTQTLWGTLDRRRHLRSTKMFDCDCVRCKDETELGTYVGNIYCSVCNGPGCLNRGAMMVSANPLDEGAVWKCEKCDHSILSKQMFWGNNALKQDLMKLNKTNPREYEDFINKYKQTLHPSNHLVLQAKLALVQLYGNSKGFSLPELTDDHLKRKIDLCHELLEVADVIESGWSKFRGTLLLELQSAMAYQIKRDYEEDKLTKAAVQDQLMESMVLLQEATDILKVETHMRDALELRIRDLSSQLDDAQVEDNQIEETNFLDVD